MNEIGKRLDLSSKLEKAFCEITGKVPLFSPHSQFDNRPPEETTAEFLDRQKREKHERLARKRTR